MNPIGLILNADKIFPEPLTLELEGEEPLALAELHSRLTRIGQIVSELKKLVAADLAGKIPTALRYGDTVYRASNGRGTAKVRDDFDWWVAVVDGLKESPRPEALIAALFPSSSVRLTALPKLEAALSLEEGRLKDLYVTYDPPSTPLSVMPIQKAPKYLQDLEEGEIR